MKKYVFLIKRATKNEVEIEAENKNEAFKKVMQFIITEDGENNVNNIDIDKEIIRFRLTKIIEKNEDGKLETKPYKRDKELVGILEEMEENDSDFRENYRRFFQD